MNNDERTKQRKKKYRDKKKKEIREYNKKYWNENKDRINIDRLDYRIKKSIETSNLKKLESIFFARIFLSLIDYHKQFGVRSQLQKMISHKKIFDQVLKMATEKEKEIIDKLKG